MAGKNKKTKQKNNKPRSPPFTKGLGRSGSPSTFSGSRRWAEPSASAQALLNHGLDRTVGCFQVFHCIFFCKIQENVKSFFQQNTKVKGLE